MKIAVVNTKGGVGKTTTAIYLATVASAQGKSTELLDADPQGSATSWAEIATEGSVPLPFQVSPANKITLSIAIRIAAEKFMVESISDEEASGVMLATMAVVTAFYAEDGHGMTPPWEEGGRHIGKGKSIAIIGGASSVGQYAIQMARLSGYERIITNASSNNHDFLKSVGAHVVLERSKSTPAAFFDATGGHPLDFVFDGISAPATQKLGIEILQKAKTAESHLVTVHTVVPDAPNPEAKALGQTQEPCIEIKQILGIGSSPSLRHLSEPLAEYLGGPDGYIAQGLFTPNRPHVVSGGLAAIEEAMKLSKEGVSGRKVIICPQETA